jgi:hypothetical protein
VGIENHFSNIFNFRETFQVIFNTYKNNEKIIPSAMRQKRRQVCGFLFAYWGVYDCFYDGLMPQTFLE